MSNQTIPAPTIRSPRHAPDAPPGCPACDGSVQLAQPDPRRPGELVGACPRCKTWVILVRVAGRWLVVRRIPASERQGPARPFTQETAGRRDRARA
jgi:hypothetical protein